MDSKQEFYKIPEELLSSNITITIAERHSGKRNYELYRKTRNNKLNDSSCKDDRNE